VSQKNIRNFCIIAHIDHGKSTLADRFLEITGTVSKRDLKEQTLDTMELERERGITIKLQPARMIWNPYHQAPKNKPQNTNNFENQNSKLETTGSDYILNLIDTPGHVDFSYEVSRSLAAVEGAILVVDASQGIEAQTLSTLYAAIDAGLEIIPVINKIDLPHAEPEKVAEEIINLLGCKKEEIIHASGKTGEGVTDILNEIIDKVPAPKIIKDSGPKALIFDSFYDSYKGVMIYVRIFNGEIKKGDKLKLMAEGNPAEVIEVGYLKPTLNPQSKLENGEIGYIVTGLKETARARVGDTVTTQKEPAQIPLSGYKKVKPFVYAGIYTTVGDDFPLLREALEKLSLSDSSLEYEPEKSQALGFGFRCGFLGLLHMEIVKERLEREFNLSLITTAPSVSYEIEKTNQEVIRISSPAELPEKTEIKEIREPFTKLEVVTPANYIGSIMELVQSKRGVYKNTSYLDETRAVLSYECPLSEIVTDFYDRLKSVSSGYASVNYEFIGYKAEDLVKVDILINSEPFDTLAIIAHKNFAQKQGDRLVRKLKELIPKQNFKIPIQAAIGGKIIAREDITALRKDVTAKLYGGDVTRKRKLLEKQKKGKEKMKMVGRVQIPSDTFIKLLKN
jgi:GTP-binding protein LepA